MIVSLLTIGLLLIPSSHAFWRMPCAQPVLNARVDPIVAPGVPSDHAHTIMGSSAIGYDTTFNDLVNSNCTTCMVNDDRSAYWAPQLYYQYANGSLEAVSHGGMIVYYLQRNAANETVVAFPDGLRMLTGDPFSRSNSGSDASQAISWLCLDYSKPATAQTPGFSNTVCPDGLRAQIFFPGCWDGVNLDSSDHRSHMAYPDGIDNGQCPYTHPIHLISIFYELWFSVDPFNKLNDGGRFVLANGDPTGYGLHGDFMDGWANKTTLSRAIETCTDDSGVIQDCPVFANENRFVPDAVMNSCAAPNPMPSENVQGPIPYLPGCVAISEGPAEATSDLDPNCVSGSGNPVPVSSTPQNTSSSSMPASSSPASPLPSTTSASGDNSVPSSSSPMPASSSPASPPPSTTPASGGDSVPSSPGSMPASSSPANSPPSSTPPSGDDSTPSSSSSMPAASSPASPAPSSTPASGSGDNSGAGSSSSMPAASSPASPPPSTTPASGSGDNSGPSSSSLMPASSSLASPPSETTTDYCDDEDDDNSSSSVATPVPTQPPSNAGPSPSSTTPAQPPVTSPNPTMSNSPASSNPPSGNQDGNNNAYDGNGNGSPSPSSNPSPSSSPASSNSPAPSNPPSGNQGGNNNAYDGNGNGGPSPSSNPSPSSSPASGGPSSIDPGAVSPTTSTTEPSSTPPKQPTYSSSSPESSGHHHGHHGHHRPQQQEQQNGSSDGSSCTGSQPPKKARNVNAKKPMRRRHHARRAAHGSYMHL